MVSVRKVKQVIDKAGISFEACWTYLSAIKSRKIKSEYIINFQLTLAEALFNLSALYRGIAQEKKKLIKEKSSYSPEWFPRRMATLSHYQDAINQTIGIGKGIGDAFAWFFYQKNRNYLREHLSQEEIFHGPPGLGGIGELEFSKNVTVLHDYLVLHHGTTSILRLGDISLIDLKTFSVAGIGEIKTSPLESEKIEISLLFSGPGINKEEIEREVVKHGVRGTTKQFMDGFPNKAKERLNRQMKRIVDSYSVLEASTETRLHFESTSSIDALNKTFKTSKCGILNFNIASNGLAIGIYRERKKALSTKLLAKGKTDFSSKISGIEDCAAGLINTDRDDNSLIVNSLYYDKRGRTPHLAGMTHLFWWPLDLDALRSIIFQDAVAFTIFNPSHLTSALEVAGYQTETSSEPSPKIYKIVGDRRIYVEGFYYYWKMITEYLFTEEGIVKMLEQVENNLVSQNITSSTRIELQIIQEL